MALPLLIQNEYHLLDLIFFIRYQPTSNVVHTKISKWGEKNKTLHEQNDKQWKTIDKWILIQNVFTEIWKCYHCVNLLILIWEKWIWCDSKTHTYKVIVFVFFRVCKWTTRKPLCVSQCSMFWVCVTNNSEQEKRSMKYYRNWYFLFLFLLSPYSMLFGVRHTGKNEKNYDPALQYLVLKRKLSIFWWISTRV